MLPGTQDLVIQQGDDFTFVFRVRSKVWDEAANGGAGGYVAGDYVNLDGYTGASEIRATANATTVLATFTVTIDPAQTDPDHKGIVIMELDHDDTTALPTSGGVWDVQLTNPAGKISTYLTGKVTVKAEVTRA